jgi:hypothetical protein
VAVRSTFTPGTVTVTATSGGLSGTTSFTTYPAPTITAVSIRPVATAFSRMPGVKIRVSGGILRYFLNRSANISFEILDASGRLVEKIQLSKQAEGWHSLRLSGRPDNGAKGNGAYFVRSTVDGYVLAAKRVILVR